jgi:hypothetical protein
MIQKRVTVNVDVDFIGGDVSVHLTFTPLPRRRPEPSLIVRWYVELHGA